MNSVEKWNSGLEDLSHDIEQKSSKRNLKVLKDKLGRWLIEIFLNIKNKKEANGEETTKEEIFPDLLDLLAFTQN